MTIELGSNEIDLVKELVKHRIEELGPEIHHTRTPEYHDDLKKLREKLRTLHERLSKAADGA